jgi:arginyl-tRNA synthetase
MTSATTPHPIWPIPTTDGLWSVRPPYGPTSLGDLILIPRTRTDWRRDTRATQSLAALDASPEIEGLIPRKRHVFVRLTEAYIQNLIADIQTGNPLGLTGLRAGQKYRVYFCDPNATKPFHIGHLRNLALGCAIAGSLEVAGAEVYRHSTVADFGRNVAEAMAGMSKAGEIPIASAMSDHYVGRCYAEYVTGLDLTGDATAAVDAPLDRELLVTEDDADRLLTTWLVHAPAVMRLSEEVRRLVLSGHDHTLARLGIGFDAMQLESSMVQHCLAIAEAGVAKGYFLRDRDSAIVYHTGVPDAPVITLVTSTGTPTQHLRCVSLWVATETSLRGATTIQVCGDEWQAHVACTEPLLELLMADKPAVHPSRHVLHGLVKESGQKVSSSSGTVQTVDGLLEYIEMNAPDWLPPESADDLPRLDAWQGQIALGYFLNVSRTSAHTFDADLLGDTARSLGSLLCAARLRCYQEQRAEPDQQLTADARYAAIRVAVIVRFLIQALDSFDYREMAQSLSHFLRWFLSRSPRNDVVSLIVSALLDIVSKLVRTPKLA